MPNPKAIVLAAALVAWIACLASAFAALQHYASTAGAAGTPEAGVERLLGAHRKPHRGLIAMVVHPSCPCTDASLAELGDLLARSNGRCDALILEYAPDPLPANWAASVPVQELGGVAVPVLADRGGRLAEALGAQTSGHVVFLDEDGRLAFHGGLTLARGHRGRAPGQDAILHRLAGQPTNVQSAPVFGCALEPECKVEAAP